MVTVLAAGHVNWDVTLRVDRLPEPDGESRIRSQRQYGGGSAANVAAALATLDVSTGLIGSVGSDENGLLARRELEACGVDLTGLVTVEGTETAVKYVLVDDAGEVAVLGNDGVNEAVTPSDVDADAVRSVRHLHLTSQRPETAAHLARIASDAGVRVSFDPGRRLADRDYAEALGYADVVFVTDREARGMLGSDEDASFLDEGAPSFDDASTVDTSGAILADDCVVVVTCGEDGARVHTPTGTYRHPGFGVDPVDTTGAGDAFAAGYIATTLADDDVERALAVANACGALASGRDGPRCRLDPEALAAFLDERR